MKFITVKATVSNLFHYNISNVFKEHPSCNNADLIIVSNNNIKIGFAIITPCNNFNLIEIFQTNMLNLKEYDEEAFVQIFNKHKKILSQSCYLNYIQINDKNKGHGTKVLNYIINKYKHVYLYSLIESEYFWRKNKFIEISEEDHNFIY